MTMLQLAASCEKMLGNAGFAHVAVHYLSPFQPTFPDMGILSLSPKGATCTTLKRWRTMWGLLRDLDPEWEWELSLYRLVDKFEPDAHFTVSGQEYEPLPAGMCGRIFWRGAAEEAARRRHARASGGGDPDAGSDSDHGSAGDQGADGQDEADDFDPWAHSEDDEAGDLERVADPSLAEAGAGDLSRSNEGAQPVGELGHAAAGSDVRLLLMVRRREHAKRRSRLWSSRAASCGTVRGQIASRRTVATTRGVAASEDQSAAMEGKGVLSATSWPGLLRESTMRHSATTWTTAA